MLLLHPATLHTATLHLASCQPHLTRLASAPAPAKREPTHSHAHCLPCHALRACRCSKARPHPRVFCAYVFTSLLGQFAVYISFLMFMQHRAHTIMPKVGTVLLCVA